MHSDFTKNGFLVKFDQSKDSLSVQALELP